MEVPTKVKVLITGASGYIGSLAVDKLKSRGHTVIAYIRDPLNKKYCNACDEFIIGDIQDTKLLTEAVQTVDYVIHLVAVLKPAECDKDPVHCQKVNVDSTVSILNALGPTQRLIFASTESCIGDIRSTVADENNCYNPTTMHRADLMTHTIAADAVKTGIIHMYQPDVPRNLLHVSDGAESIVFAVENASPSGNEIYAFVMDLSSLRERYLTHSKANLEENIMHIEYTNQGVYNIGSKDLQIKKIDVAKEICKIVGGVKIVTISGHDDNCRLYHLNLDKIYDLGFRPKVGLHDGLVELIEYLKFINDVN